MLECAGPCRSLLAFELEHFLLEDADDVQLLEHPHQRGGVVGLPVGLGRLEAGPDGVGRKRFQYRHSLRFPAARVAAEPRLQ